MIHFVSILIQKSKSGSKWNLNSKDEIFLRFLQKGKSWNLSILDGKLNTIEMETLWLISTSRTLYFQPSNETRLSLTCLTDQENSAQLSSFKIFRNKSNQERFPFMEHTKLPRSSLFLCCTAKKNCTHINSNKNCTQVNEKYFEISVPSDFVTSEIFSLRSEVISKNLSPGLSKVWIVVYLSQINEYQTWKQFISSPVCSINLYFLFNIYLE